MKTSVIRYRVADFLREHPPFDAFSLEDLLAFSGTGRVIFHEDDIQVFHKGQPRDRILWVIQQGRIELVDETPAGAQLRDVLGPGDIVGLARSTDSEAHSHTARTATEVILYAFDVEAFETLVNKYPEASRYLTAHLSATSRHTKALQAPANKERLQTEREKKSWLHAAPPPHPSQFFQPGQASRSGQDGQGAQSLWTRRLVTCAPEIPIREAVARMVQARGAAITLVTDDGRPLGLITDRELRGFVTTGAVSSNAPAGELMNSKFQTASPGLRIADYLLEMARGRCQELVITVDGTMQTPLKGVVTDDDLTIMCGRNPTLLIREALAAETVEELSDLRQRAEAFLAENLVGPTTVEWLWQMASEVNAAIIERITQIAEGEMARAGRRRPDTQSCWLFFGRAGRRETLSPEAPVLGLVYQDAPELETKPEKDDIEKYFSTLVQKVEVKLLGCGFRPRQNLSGTVRGAFCRAFSEWEEFYSGLIRDPIGNAIYDACDFFDARVVCGDPSLWSALKKTILAELERNEAFIPVLANDTLAALPPLTFFQGFVIETDGARRQTLDLEKTALSPIVDAARVFALAAGEVSNSNTLRRLEFAASASPLRASVFNDAADGLRIASYQQALAQFNGSGEDPRINPLRLSRFEQRLLKSAFDSVRRLIELTSTTYDLDQRLSQR